MLEVVARIMARSIPQVCLKGPGVVDTILIDIEVGKIVIASEKGDVHSIHL